MKVGSGALTPPIASSWQFWYNKKAGFNPALLTHVLHLRTESTYQTVVSVHVTNCGDRNGTLPESGSRWFFADKGDKGQIDGRRGPVHFHP